MNEFKTDLTGSEPDNVAEGVEASSEMHAARRRAAIAKIGRLAALSSPALVTLLISDRASADSPPPDPV